MAVTLDAIATRLGRTAPEAGSAEAAQWEQLVADALLLIRARLGDPANLDPENLGYVVREAVVAHLRNPDDATQVDVAVDDARVSRRYSSSAGRVTILAEWWDMLAPTADSPAFSVRPTFETDRPAPDLLRVSAW